MAYLLLYTMLMSCNCLELYSGTYITDTIGELHVRRYRGPAVAEGFYKYYMNEIIAYVRYSGVAIKQGCTVITPTV